MSYTIYVDNKLQKTYPFKAQAVIWCYLNCFVSSDGRGRIFLDNRVEIKEDGE